MIVLWAPARARRCCAPECSHSWYTAPAVLPSSPRLVVGELLPNAHVTGVQNALAPFLANKLNAPDANLITLLPAAGAPGFA